MRPEALVKTTSLALGAAVALTACGTGATRGGGEVSGDTGGDTTQTEGAGLLETATEDGITIAFANEVPYGFTRDGEPTGEAPAVAMAILEEMGITEVEGSVVEFGALINGLNAGRFDMIAAGMFITEERAQQALFTDPDYCAGTAFAVQEGNPKGLTDFASVAESDATVGVLSGAVEDGYATAAGVPDDQIQRFQSTPDLVDALTSDRIDAFALTSPTVRAQADDTSGVTATDVFFPTVDGEEQRGCGGFVFRFEDEEFRNRFNEILVEMRENDEILPIIEEFGFTQEETDAAKGTSVEDLIGQPYDFGMTTS